MTAVGMCAGRSDAYIRRDSDGYREDLSTCDSNICEEMWRFKQRPNFDVKKLHAGPAFIES